MHFTKLVRIIYFRRNVGKNKARFSFLDILRIA